MGVSFKVSRKGWRYRPKVVAGSSSSATDPETPPPPPAVPGDVGEDAQEAATPADVVLAKQASETFCVEEQEASFSINLYADGFSLGKPAEGMLLPLVLDAPKVLHPYDKTAETLFNAIRTGWLPGDLLDDLPCKYHNGSITCEVWDFRTFKSKTGDSRCLPDEFPFFRKVRLRMGMENVIKDLKSISNDSWSYNDLLLAEARIIKVMQPVLHLDPALPFSRIGASPISNEIDLRISHSRPYVECLDEGAVIKKSSNLLCYGGVSGDGYSNDHGMNGMFGEVCNFCDESSPKDIALDLCRRYFQQSISLVCFQMARDVDRRQGSISVTSATSTIDASSTLHAEKYLGVLRICMNPQTLPKERESDEHGDARPTWRSSHQRPRIKRLESSPPKKKLGRRRTTSRKSLQWKNTQLLQ